MSDPPADPATAPRPTVVPEEALGYSYGGGGISNQKIGIIGLFISAYETGAPLALPDMYIYDQIRNNGSTLPFDTVFDEDDFRQFADRFGLSFSDSKRAYLRNISKEERKTVDKLYEKVFWKARGVFESKPVAGQDPDLSEFVLSLLSAFNARIGKSYLFAKLQEDVFGRAGVSVAAQFRVEADWERHCRLNLNARLKQPEDVFIPFDRIIEKTLATFPQTRRIYVICDEPGLPQTKHVMKSVGMERYGVDLLFKTDFLSGFEIDLLRPLQLSLLDFEMALHAEVFVGMSRSTFTNMVSLQTYGVVRKAVTNHYIYNLAGPMLARRRDNGRYPDPVRATGGAVS